MSTAMLAVGPASQRASASSCVTRTLASLALTPRRKRADPNLTVFWDRYKNDPRFATWIDGEASLQSATSPADASRVLALTSRYDQLSQSELKAIEPKSVTFDLMDPCNGQTCGAQTGPAALLAYQVKVIHLRRGDVVRYGSRSFKLGKFLGAGNATHVWEIEGMPGKALRLPFLSDAEGKAGEAARTLEEIRAPMFSLRKEPPFGLKHVRVHEFGPRGEFAVVTRLHGETNGEQFADTYQALLDELDRIRLSGSPADHAALARKHSLTEPHVRKIEDQYRKLKATREKYAVLDETDIDDRQFVWEEADDDWILMDW